MIRNERIKLLANFLNNIGLAFVIGGFVAPTISGQASHWLGAVQVPLIGAVSLSNLFQLIWIFSGFGLHLGARIVLGGMRE